MWRTLIKRGVRVIRVVDRVRFLPTDKEPVCWLNSQPSGRSAPPIRVHFVSARSFNVRDGAQGACGSAG